MESDDIIDKAVKYIETRFGETPIERNDKAMQTIRRDKDEDMTEFIQSVKPDKAWSKQCLISSRHGINRIRFFAEAESSSA